MTHRTEPHLGPAHAPAPAPLAAGTPVVLLVTERTHRARLEQALRAGGGASRTTVVARIAELHEACAREMPALLVAEATDADDTPVDVAIAALRQRDPALVVVGFIARGPSLSRQVFTFGSAGVHELIFAEADELAIHVRAALHRAGARAGAARVADALTPHVHGTARTVLRHVLEHAAAAPRVGDLARALAIPRRTLVHRMAAAGLPAPAELAMWARLLLAADRLAREPRPVDDIALSLGFSGDNALRNACRRWLDASPTELRAGGLELALTRFRTRMHTVRTQRARLRSGHPATEAIVAG
jgi:AraC-like DNA-binding protein